MRQTETAWPRGRRARSWAYCTGNPRGFHPGGAIPHFSPIRGEIVKWHEIQAASSENKGAYCGACDRVRVEDATQELARFAISWISLERNPG